MLMYLAFFVLQQKTAYEMRISDWSSDVCSSDLLILGKGGRPKKQSTVDIDLGRIERHVIPLLGSRRVKDLTKAIITKAMRDIMAGKTKAFIKTKTTRGRATVGGGPGTVPATVGLIDGILNYAVDRRHLGCTSRHGTTTRTKWLKKGRMIEIDV